MDSVTEGSSNSLLQYLYFVSYILKLNLREMLNFECKDNDCFIYIKHNETKMPEAGIPFTEASKYLEKPLVQEIAHGHLMREKPEQKIRVGWESFNTKSL